MFLFRRDFLDLGYCTCNTYYESCRFSLVYCSNLCSFGHGELCSELFFSQVLLESLPAFPTLHQRIRHHWLHHFRSRHLKKKLTDCVHIPQTKLIHQKLYFFLKIKTLTFLSFIKRLLFGIKIGFAFHQFRFWWSFSKPFGVF